MSEAPDALVEKAAEVIRTQYDAVDAAGDGYKPAPMTLARIVLAAVLPDVRRAVAEEMAERCCDEVGQYARLVAEHGDDNNPLNATHRLVYACKQESYEDAARIAREIGAP